MTWKTDTIQRARLRAHSDGRPCRLWSKPTGNPTRRRWIFRPTLGKSERELNAEAGKLERDGFEPAGMVHGRG